MLKQIFLLYLYLEPPVKSILLSRQELWPSRLILAIKCHGFSPVLCVQHSFLSPNTCTCGISWRRGIRYSVFLSLVLHTIKEKWPGGWVETVQQCPVCFSGKRSCDLFSTQITGTNHLNCLRYLTVHLQSQYKPKETSTQTYQKRKWSISSNTTLISVVFRYFVE